MNRENHAAIILAGGLGGRFLPASKSINKCMMPILNKPVIQYIVEDCIGAGIEHIVIITPEGDNQIKNHFMVDEQLYARFKDIGKANLYEERVKPLVSISDKLHFVEQKANMQYGTATPIKLGIESLPDYITNIFAMNGDQIVSPGKPDIIGSVAEALDQADGAPAIIGVKVDISARSRYGVPIEKPGQPGILDQIVEKPNDDYSPTSLTINLGWYSLPRSIVNYIDKTDINQTDNELFITDSINMMAKDTEVKVLSLNGEFLDCGTPEKWLHTNNVVAKLTGL